MHHIHRTKAFVIGSVPFSESDKQLFLLTEELGLVRATAQGSRKQESRMRQSIQDYSFLDAALVAGRAGWRLVNAAAISPATNFYLEIGDKNKKLRDAVCRVFSLIERLVAGEESDPQLFRIVQGFVEFSVLEQEFLISNKWVREFEVIFNAHILNLLGYLDISGFDKYIINSPEEITSKLASLLEELDNQDVSLQKKMIKEINSAIKHSNL